MWLQVLGSAAGGGFPQWNCGCQGCRAVREGSRPAEPRTQSSVAVSADHRNWFLLNASPDLRAQFAAFPALHPREGRVTPLQAVLLTDAELDHTLGLVLLREAPALELHATRATYTTLRHGTGLVAMLERYCRVDWRPVELGEEVALADGLSYRAFDAPTTKRARFEGGAAASGRSAAEPPVKRPDSGGSEPGRVVGYRLTDGHSGRAAVYLPGMQRLTAAVRRELDDCACLLVDGTCWHDDELIRLGLADKTASEMGHLPIAGPHGSLAQLAALPVERKIYTHVNNTNPILLDDGPERRIISEHGMEVAVDGLEVKV
jgi:pyrroloquinoline quinone biosynthesis protein B